MSAPDGATSCIQRRPTQKHTKISSFWTHHAQCVRPEGAALFQFWKWRALGFIEYKLPVSINGDWKKSERADVCYVLWRNSMPVTQCMQNTETKCGEALFIRHSGLTCFFVFFSYHQLFNRILFLQILLILSTALSASGDLSLLQQPWHFRYSEHGVALNECGYL